jgi:hypothetical protein
MINYAAILSRRYAGKEWTLNGDEYTGLTWLSDDAKPTKATLDGLWASVQQEIADEAAAKVSAREALLTKLGITADEAQLLLGA